MPLLLSLLPIFAQIGPYTPPERTRFVVASQVNRSDRKSGYN